MHVSNASSLPGNDTRSACDKNEQRNCRRKRVHRCQNAERCAHVRQVEDEQDDQRVRRDARKSDLEISYFFNLPRRKYFFSEV